ncbi:hypothetical protein ACFLR1_07270 [Bacteroidota bacterium]
MELLKNKRAAVSDSSLISVGQSTLCVRVYANAIIRIENTSALNTEIAFSWKKSGEKHHVTDKEFVTLVPGSTLKFLPIDEPGNQFLDTIVFWHIAGGEVQVSILIPEELLN